MPDGSAAASAGSAGGTAPVLMAGASSSLTSSTVTGRGASAADCSDGPVSEVDSVAGAAVAVSADLAALAPPAVSGTSDVDAARRQIRQPPRNFNEE